MDFKKLTDNIISRPSTHIVTLWTIITFFLSDRPKTIFGAWGLFFPPDNGDYFYSAVSIMLILLLVSTIEILCECKLNFKFGCKVLQNKPAKAIVIPLYLYGLLFLIIPVLLIALFLGAFMLFLILGMHK